MKVIIIEDEKLSAEHLSTLLKKIDASATVVATLDSVKKSITEFKKGLKADLLFVDVHLADGLSFDIFSSITLDVPVIFTTAYDEYAIEAFTVNSIDYLLKPVGMLELERAVNKFKKLKGSGDSRMMENLATAYHQMNKSYKNRFMVKMGDTITTVKTDDLSHFISEDGLVLLVCNNRKRYAIDYTLDELEKMLSPADFFRINRKVILHISSIQKVSPYFNSRLKLNSESLNEEACIVSRERVNDFKAWLDK